MYNTKIRKSKYLPTLYFYFIILFIIQLLFALTKYTLYTKTCRVNSTTHHVFRVTKTTVFHVQFSLT